MECCEYGTWSLHHKLFYIRYYFCKADTLSLSVTSTVDYYLRENQGDWSLVRGSIRVGSILACKYLSYVGSDS